LHEITHVSGTSRIDNVDQPSAYGQTDFGYNDKGDRHWDTNYGNDEREYGYDDRRQMVSVNGFYKPTGTSSWHQYYLTNVFDQRGRRISKSFHDTTTSQLSTTYFYYDPANRLIEVQHWPDTATTSVYSVHQVLWLDTRPVAMTQTDYPAATLSRRFIHGDDVGRPLEMYSWPSSGDGVRVWATNTDAWSSDDIVLGTGVFQPLLFGGQVRDDETTAWHDYAQRQRPALVHLTRGRTYDPFLGIHLQSYGGLAGAESYGYGFSVQNPVGPIYHDDQGDCGDDPHPPGSPVDTGTGELPERDCYYDDGPGPEDFPPPIDNFPEPLPSDDDAPARPVHPVQQPRPRPPRLADAFCTFVNSQYEALGCYLCADAGTIIIGEPVGPPPDACDLGPKDNDRRCAFLSQMYWRCLGSGWSPPEPPPPPPRPGPVAPELFCWPTGPGQAQCVELEPA
jgi:hypothetical protein